MKNIKLYEDYSPGERDPFEDIRNAVNLEYLRGMKDNVEYDIQQLNDESPKLKALKAKMMGISEDELDIRRMDYLLELLEAIEKRMGELKG